MSSTPSTSVSFFSPVASSFCSAPYPTTVSSGSSASSPLSSFSTRNAVRNHDPLAIPQSMDPQPTDPNVLFIHPPFNTFPNAHLYPDGLTYILMADNPEWFLDPSDFVSPAAITYPTCLEPPRGWCPAKKKDLKERGGDSWPEGEEPRLRCTFCRRTYAGVNAKSMWRRHVFEKHKIAMSNRRDGNLDRPRGRGSGKENKQLVSVKNSDSHDGLISIIVTPQTAPDTSSLQSRFRSGIPNEMPKKRDRERRKISRQESLPLTSPQAKKVLSSQSEEDSECEGHAKPSTPPLTPHVEGSSDPPNIIGFDSLTASPIISRPVIPESPYNPLQTPSFRHSPPRLPSEQPWRFPSPSHPLHSNTRDMSLTMLTRPLETPVIKRLPTLGISPVLAIQSSPLSNIVQMEPSSVENQARPNWLFGKLLTNRSRFSDQIPSPLNMSKSRSRQRIASSPLPFMIRQTPKSHSRHPSDASEQWFSDVRLVSSASSLPIEELRSSDPFSVYGSWPSATTAATISPVRLPKPPLEIESPVLRSGSLSSLDIGLLEPFGEVDTQINYVDDDILLSSPAMRCTLRSEGKRATPPAANSTDCSPPSKKRRMWG